MSTHTHDQMASRAGLEAFRGATLPDLIGPRTRLLFVGVNPGLSAAAVQAPFPGHGNRFFPALFEAGITDRLIDTRGGYAPGDREYLTDLGIGLTVLVAAATARADELSPGQLIAGAASLTRKVVRVRPATVAFLGISAYRVAFTQPKAIIGPQPRPLAGAQLWVVPSPKIGGRYAPSISPREAPEAAQTKRFGPSRFRYSETRRKPGQR
jgi:TDG/mug DNA glycosylase family protein